MEVVFQRVVIDVYRRSGLLLCWIIQGDFIYTIMQTDYEHLPNKKPFVYWKNSSDLLQLKEL